MKKLIASARRGVATFLFATLGCLVGFPILDVDVATWKVALSTGLGSIVNTVYRWSEAVVNERRSAVDDELVGADVKDRGGVDVVTVLVVIVLCLGIVFLWRQVA